MVNYERSTVEAKMEKRSFPATNCVWYRRLVIYLWYDVVLSLYIGIICILKEIFSRLPIPMIEEINKRTGQVVVLTGGPRGIALGVIKRLVQLDYTIVLGVRNIKDSQNRLDAFSEINKDISLNKITLLEMDLNSLNSVRSFANAVLALTSRIDLLLCNAAIMGAPYEVTVDGYESQFQVNYLSNFLLTQLLLERLKGTAEAKGGPCQIIYTSSVAYKYGKFNIDELETPSIHYTPFKFFYASKLYPVMSMLRLQRLLEDENAQVYCYAVHPGLIPTDIWFTGGGCLIGWIGRLASKMFRTPENAADIILWPSISQKYLNIGGLYMESGSVISISDQAKNRDFQEALYSKSMQLIGMS